jgi:hypothetical protein
MTSSELSFLFTRECLALIVDTSLARGHVARELDLSWCRRRRTPWPTTRPHVRQLRTGSPSHGKLLSRIAPENRRLASSMGDEPHELYHVRWTRCA